MATSNFNKPFVPATTYPLNWNVGENRFAEEGDEQTQQLSVFVPECCMHELITYLTQLQFEKDRLQDGTTWDSAAKEKVKVKGFYINGKGRDGEEGGSFGNIHLAKIDTPAQAAPSSIDSF